MYKAHRSTTINTVRYAIQCNRHTQQVDTVSPQMRIHSLFLKTKFSVNTTSKSSFDKITLIYCGETRSGVFAHTGTLEHASVTWNIALDRITCTVDCHTAVGITRYKRE
jgi:hypothetical protein